MGKSKANTNFISTAPTLSKISLAFFAVFFIVGGFYYLSSLLATDGSAQVTIEPSSATVVPGQNFDVAVYVDSGSDEMDTVQARVDFDPAQFELLEVNDQNSGFGIEAPTGQSDSHVTIARGNTSPLTGRHLLASLTFRAVAQGGTGVLAFSNSDTLVLRAGNQLTTTLQNAEFTFAGNADVFLSPGSGQVSVGEDFQVAVMVDSGEFLMDAVEVRLTFDSGQFSYVSHDSSQSDFNVEAPFDQGDGFVQLARGSSSPLTGEKLLTIFKFNVEGQGGSATIAINADNTNVVYAGGSLTTDLQPGNYELADLSPPTIPGNLTAEAMSKTQVDLSWSASTDNVGVTGYHVYRDGERVANDVVGTSFSDTGLTLNTTYTYYVVAVDAAGNVSDPTDEVSVTTHRKLGDINGDNVVNIFDLSILLSEWTQTGDNAADLNGDGVVDIFDLSILLANWEG